MQNTQAEKNEGEKTACRVSSLQSFNETPSERARANAEYWGNAVSSRVKVETLTDSEALARAALQLAQSGKKSLGLRIEAIANNGTSTAPANGANVAELQRTREALAQAREALAKIDNGKKPSNALLQARDQRIAELEREIASKAREAWKLGLNRQSWKQTARSLQLAKLR